MPSVTLRAIGPDLKEETMTEYICDWPDCPDAAEHIVGVIAGLRAYSAVCKKHAALIAAARRQRQG